MNPDLFIMYLLIAFYVFLFILQIVYFIIAVKKKENYLWKKLFIMELATIISAVFVIIFLICLDHMYKNLYDLYYFFDIILLLPYIILYTFFALIFNIIKLFISKKISKEKKPLKIKAILIIIILFTILLVVLASIYPVLDDMKQKNDAIKEKNEMYSKVKPYLNEKYGLKNVNIIDYSITREEAGTSMFGDTYYDIYYNFSVKIPNLKEIVHVLVNSSFCKDDFIEKYAEEKNIDDKVLDKFLKNIPKSDDYTANFKIYYNDFASDYGKIPTDSEIINNGQIEFEYFDINKSFSNENEFKEFAKSLYKDYKNYYVKYKYYVTEPINFYIKDDEGFLKDYDDSGYIKDNSEGIFVNLKLKPPYQTEYEIFISNEELES